MSVLPACLASIARACPRIPHEIVVVDNASTDGSWEWLNEYSKSCAVHLILARSDRNTGFGAANNRGMELTNAPLLMLLNSDTIVFPGAIDLLCESLLSQPEVGACGPRLQNNDGTLQISAWRNPPAPWEILLTESGLYRMLPQPLRGELLLGGHWRHNRQRTAGMLSGAAFLVRREVVREVGGFNEGFHMYGEDNEWCLRIVRRGWKLLYVPAAVITHLGGSSSKQRWTELEQCHVQFQAFLHFHDVALGRGRTVANLIALYVAAALQVTARRLLARPASTFELQLARYGSAIVARLRDRHVDKTQRR